MIELTLKKRLRFAGGESLLDLSLSLEPGSFVTLYGKSGAGKTSVLRMLAGLMKPDSGRIQVEGASWFDSAQKINLPPQRRKVGFVFQDYALFPNMTVHENLLFALEKGQSKEEVRELISVMELEELKDAKPDLLSGGQKQRVALARALVRKPKLLMLDEPLAALDQEMRLKLQDYLIRLHKRFQLTTILVSHDIAEIRKLSGRVVELDQGRVVREGTPNELFPPQEATLNFQLKGEVVEVVRQETNYLVSVITLGQDTLNFEVERREGENLKVGEKVSVTFHALNAVIQKV